MRASRTRRGFSLTELLVVVAVILILVALLIVGVSTTYTHAMQLKCQHRLEQIGHACTMYASQHHGVLPAAWNFYTSQPWHETLIAGGYLNHPVAATCPLAGPLSDPGSGEYRPPVPAETQDAVLKALRWLKENQNGDGSWPTGTGTYMKDNPHGISGMAVMCFLGYGCTTTAPAEFADTVRKGLEYLLGVQGTGSAHWDTYDGPPVTKGWFQGGGMYATGIGAIAASDAFALMGDLKFQTDQGEKGLKDAATRAIQFITNRQSSTSGAWGYGGGGVDTSITSWVAQGIVAAGRAGVAVSADTLSKTHMWLEKSICVNRFACVSGLYVCARCGYIGVCPADNICPRSGCGGSLYNGWLRRCTWSTDGSTPSSDGNCPECHGSAQNVPDDYRVPYQMNTYGGPHSLRNTTAGDRRLTTMSLAARILLGHRPAVNAPTGSQARNSWEQLRWLKDAGDYLGAGEACTDLYFIYYMSIALQRLGGDEWTAWENVYVEPLVAEQNPDGTWAASLAVFGAADCPTYPTALACLSLEASIGQYLPGSRWATAAAHSYGFNPYVGTSRQTAASDTILAIDYMLSEINRENPKAHIAPRHGGKANALRADGSVVTLDPDDIPDGMWTPGPGD